VPELWRVEVLLDPEYSDFAAFFSSGLPEEGLGEAAATRLLTHQIHRHSTPLGNDSALAHMDPPPPDVAIEITRLNAAYNQNLLHPDLSPLATRAEEQVIRWLADAFAMDNGHMCGGSTLANLTALWAAREHGADTVVSSIDAHLSIPKAAHILGLEHRTLPVTPRGRMVLDDAPDLSRSALVLTAGTTGRGAIDPLTHPASSAARWVHVDAAWGGPLRLSRYRARRDGVDAADSVAVSAHKWFFQPKESALCLFRTPEARDAVSFSSSYLARPNIGVQGSRGAIGLTLLATLLAWGRRGLDERIHACMELAETLAERLQDTHTAELHSWPETAIVNWRPVGGVAPETCARLRGVASTVVIDGEQWMRNVAANPQARLDAVWARVRQVL